MRGAWAAPRIMSLGAEYDTDIVSIISYYTFACCRVKMAEGAAVRVSFLSGPDSLDTCKRLDVNFVE